MDRPEFFIAGWSKSKSGLIVPTGHADPRPAATYEVAGTSEGPGLVLARRPVDLLELMFRPFPAEEDTKGLTRSSLADLIAMCQQLPFDTAIRAFSQVAAALNHCESGADDLALAKIIYGPDVPIIGFFEEFIEDPRARLFGEQHFFALERLVIQHAPEGEVGDDEKSVIDFNTGVKRSVMAAATIIADSVTELDKLDDVERWLVVLVQNGFYNAQSPPLNSWSRAWELVQIARRPEEEGGPDYCPIDRWMNEAFGVSVEEQFALGFGLMAISGVLDDDRQLGERCLIQPGAVDDLLGRTGLEGRRGPALDAISAPREWFKTQFDQGNQSAMDVAWNRKPFEQRPFLRTADDGLLLLSPRGIISWLGEGFRHRVIAAIEQLFADGDGRCQAEKQRFFRFFGRLVEVYAVELLQAVHPTIGDGPGRVQGEQSYDGKKSPDVTVDSTPDLAVIEVVSAQLSQKTVVDADLEAFESDVHRMVGSKVTQLGKRLGDMLDDEVEIPGVDFAAVSRIWPVVVTAGDLTQSDLLWDHLEPTVKKAMALRRVQQFTLLDLEDLEILAGLVEDGQELCALLRRKANSPFHRTELKQWLRTDPTAPKEVRTDVIDERWRSLSSEMIRRLGFSEEAAARVGNES